MGAWAGAICVLGISAYIIQDIITRHFFLWSSGLSEELSAYMLIGITFLGAAYTFVLGRHITVDVVLTRLPPQAQRVMNIANGIIGVIFCTVMTWYTSQFVMITLRRGITSEQSMIPLFIPGLLIVIGLGILGLSILAHTIRLFKP
jgi:TRAP-type C4-dicarboxylate transport system permease small subunit